MRVIGIDPHKQSHTAVAADELGRKKARKTVRARRGGHRELIAWAREIAPAGRLRAVEDVRHVAGGLIRELLAAGEQVVFVPPELMAGERRGGRERGKSDPIDALAIARLALREGAGLPAARLDEQVLEVRRLTDYRDDLVAERTRVVNRLRGLVRDLDPELAPPPRSLGSGRTRAKLEAGLRALPAGAGRAVALSQLARVTALSAEITGLEQDLAGLVTVLVPERLAIPGVAVITAAKIIGEAADIRRFRSPAAFARHTGTAPVPASSGTGTGGPQRLNPGRQPAAQRRPPPHRRGPGPLPSRRRRPAGAPRPGQAPDPQSQPPRPQAPPIRRHLPRPERRRLAPRPARPARSLT
jgi:transposase